MDNNLNTPVAEQDGRGAGTVPAISTGSAPQGGATPTVLTDEAVRKQIEAATQKYEEDIRKLKSSFDKREADRQRTMDQREQEFNRKLKELELRGMDDETRKKYEVEHKEDEFNRLVQEKQIAEQRLVQIQQAHDYEKFFLENGVSSKDLIMDQGLEALAESGWKALRSLVGTLRAENEKLKAGAPPSETTLPDAPNTLSHTSQTPAKLSLAEAAKKYAGGDEDRLYTMIEKEMLSASVLNLPKEK